MGDEPQPTPIPIRIVSDPKIVQEMKQVGVEGVNGGKRNDMFYEAWDKFLALEPERAKTTSRPAAAVYGEKKSLQAATQGLHMKRNAAQSWVDAAEACRNKVAAITHECRRLNQKYRDAQFDLEADPYSLMSLGGRFPKACEKIGAPPWVKRVGDIFPKPSFFGDGPRTSVHQGSGGDCWFLAALIAAAAKPELIEKLCVARDERVGVYGFVFWRDGEWVYEVIDDKLYIKVGDDDDLKVVRDWDKDNKKGTSLRLIDSEQEALRDKFQKGGKSLYFSYCESEETWLPLIEKAYAKAHGDYFAIEGGFASEGIEDVTGGVGVVLNPEEIMDKEQFWKEQLLQVNQKYLFGGGSRPKAEKGMIPAHAYAVLQAYEEGDLRLLKIQNPWGEVEWSGDWSDGSKLWTPEIMKKLNHKFGDDGEFWISYTDFLKHFPCINRVRLFDENWQITQHWTCVEVPWTVDYLDTKFQFHVVEAGPVVVVLSQPDDRFFLGLRGRFLFSMHFRVYREGNIDDWIVRSMHNSGNESLYTRSVSAEIDHLEPGIYNVIFKVVATRSPGSATAEEAIFKYATERKEKLLSVGRRFDYAMTKGNLRGMECAIRRQRKQNEKDKKRREQIKVRKLNQQEKDRARKRRQRIEKGMSERRQELEIKQKERQERREKEQREKEHLNKQNGNEGNGCEDSVNRIGQDRVNGQSPASSKVRDSGYESPLELVQLEDDDFDWDSDMDGRLDSDVEDSEAKARADAASSPENGIFASDPWNALCVLGLRVYSKYQPVSITVVQGELEAYRSDSLAGLSMVRPSH